MESVRVAMEPVRKPPRALRDTGIMAPDGRRFAWGPIDAIHRVGRYEVVEYRRDTSNHSASQPWVWDSHGKTQWHPYIDGRDTNMSFNSLESAIVGAIACARSGPNSQAASHFDLITLGILPDDDDD